MSEKRPTFGLIFFGRNTTNKVSSQKTLYYANSNNLCFRRFFFSEVLHAIKIADTAANPYIGNYWQICIQFVYIFTFSVSRRQREMYCGHVCLCVCPQLHAHTIAWTQM